MLHQLRTLAKLIPVLLLLVGCSSSPSVDRPGDDLDELVACSRVAQELEATFFWNAHTNQGRLEGRGWSLVMAPGIERMLLSGEEVRLLEPVRLVDGEVYLPRLFVESRLKPMVATRRTASRRYRPRAAPTVVHRRPSALVPTARSTGGGGLRGWTITIDAGHGGKDPGASKGGVQEKRVVLPVALELGRHLQRAGARVVQTRTSDVFVSLDERVAIARNARSQLFVSIHANSCPQSHIHGVEVYVKSSPGSAEVVRESWDLGKRIASAVSSGAGASNRKARRNRRELRVLKHASMPAVLVELGYLTNASERRRLADSAYRSQLSQAVFAGISSHAAGRRLRRW